MNPSAAGVSPGWEPEDRGVASSTSCFEPDPPVELMGPAAAAGW